MTDKKMVPAENTRARSLDIDPFLLKQIDKKAAKARLRAQQEPTEAELAERWHRTTYQPQQEALQTRHQMHKEMHQRQLELPLDDDVPF